MRLALGIGVVVLVTGLAASLADVGRGADCTLRSNTRGITAVLSSRRAECERYVRLDFLFMILNESREDISLDGRMSWPGNISLYVRLPDGTTLLARRGHVKMRLLSANEIMTLEAGHLSGRELAIGRIPSELLAEPLRNPKPGTYAFWVEFYGAGAPSLGCRSISLKSNEVTITIP